MIRDWLKDTVSWLKLHWLGWFIILVYVGLLYWMARMNWQIVKFPVFFAIFAAASIILPVAIKYVRKGE